MGIAVAANAADVRFCHLAVGQSSVNVKGKIGMMETAVISFPGCATLSGVDMSATQFELVNAADESTIATSNLMMPTDASRGASYVLVVPDSSNNPTFLQPRGSGDIAATINGAVVISQALPTSGINAGDTVLAGAIGSGSVTSGNDRARWFLDVVSAGGSSSPASTSTPAPVIVAVFAAVASVAALLL